MSNPQKKQQTSSTRSSKTAKAMLRISRKMKLLARLEKVLRSL